MPLTNLKAQHAKGDIRPYKLFDSGGLFLHVQPNGRKYWRLKYRFNRKEKLMALGTYPEVSLADARRARDQAKEQLRNYIDPVNERRLKKLFVEQSAANTFSVLTLEWWEKQKGRWSKDHSNRVLSSLKKEVFPFIGNRPISEIEPPEVLYVIRKIEDRRALDVASRVLQRCSAVFRYAVQTGRAKYNPASELSGALETRKVKHQPSLPRSELPEFLQRLREYDGFLQTRYALKLLLLTFVRPGELRFAQWSEFDFDAAEWRIAAERMKMKSEHIVPLSTQALDVLRQQQQISWQYELVFPGERDWRKPISENTLGFAIYRLGYKGRATAHGFRATASSILNEQGFNRDAIERQLSHQERNKVRGAYTHHAEYLNDRRKMMQWWADYLDQLEQGNNVIPINF